MMWRLPTSLTSRNIDHRALRSSRISYNKAESIFAR
jgi:hypothetical protein